MRIALRSLPPSTGGLVLVAVLGLVVASPALAQTDWSIEGTLPSYAEYNAPPPLCPTVPPPYAVVFPPVPAPGCPANGPFPPLTCSVAGGTAFDNNGNPLSGGPPVPAMVHSDGFTLEMTTAAGAYITSMPVPPGAILGGPITGVGYDSAADVIWITDGFLAAGVGIAPACPIPAVIFPPFPIPSPTGAPQNGLDWDPCTGTLWAADCGGFVSNWAIGGAFLFGFPASPPLGPMLTGLAVNTTNGNIQVTDGFVVAEFTPFGAVAPAGPFYLSANPFPIPLWGAPVDGLGFSLRPQNYGFGCSPVGPPPTITWGGGYPYAGNGGFTLAELGGPAGAIAILVFGFAPACPPLPVGGCPGGALWVSPPFGGIIGVGIVPGGGAALVIPAPIPPPVGGACGFPVGVPLFVQFVNIIPGGGLALTDALSLTIGAI
ncbi:MAG: hypothetical protein AB1486_05515 [Planctomycetota bacterium]